MAEHSHYEYDGTFAEAAAIIRAASQCGNMTIDDGLLNEIPADDLSGIIDKVHNQFEDIFKIFYPN